MNTQWNNSDLHTLLTQQREHRVMPFILFTDFDDTYYTPADLQTTRRIADLTQKEHIPTVIVTGNSVKKMLNVIQTIDIHPEVIIGQVGTGIVIRTHNDSGAEYGEDTNFVSLLSSIPFPKPDIIKALEQLMLTSKGKKSDLKFQPPASQNTYKI